MLTVTHQKSSKPLASNIEQNSRIGASEIVDKLHSLIALIGYPRLTESEVNQIIAAGSFVKGGVE